MVVIWLRHFLEAHEAFCYTAFDTNISLQRKGSVCRELARIATGAASFDLLFLLFVFISFKKKYESNGYLFPEALDFVSGD